LHHGNRQNHREILLGIDLHFINHTLICAIKKTRKDLRSTNKFYRTTKATHDEKIADASGKSNKFLAKMLEFHAKSMVAGSREGHPAQRDRQAGSTVLIANLTAHEYSSN
jgi:hypothetical protein